VPVDLRFLNGAGRYISVLASKATALQNLLRYINHTQTLMQGEWKACQELPLKFLRNINESLVSAVGTEFIPTAYHMVVTGECIPTMKEWLVEELTERVRTSVDWYSANRRFRAKKDGKRL
jgi:anaphase-promoting complex subunit 4